MSSQETNKIWIEYTDKRFFRLDTLLLKSLDQLLPAIQDSLVALKGMESKYQNLHAHIILWLDDSYLLEATSHCAFKLTIHLRGKGDDQKVELLVTDPNGYIGSDVGFAQVPPYSCVKARFS